MALPAWLRKLLGLDDPQPTTPSLSPSPSPSLSPSPSPSPDLPSTGKKRQPKGFFALQPGSDDVLPTKSSRRISESALRLPTVSGLTIRIRPYWILNIDRSGIKTWNWSFVDECVALCHKVNKPYKLLPMSGDGTIPWSSANLNYWREFYSALGNRYASDPLCVGVHVSGGTRAGTSEELHPDPAWGAANNKNMVATYKTLITAASDNFPNCSVWLAGSVQGQARNYIEEIITFGLQKAPGRFGYKNNALKYEPTTINAPHNQIVVKTAQRGALMGFEMVGSSLEDRFGSTDVMDGVRQGYKLAAQVPYPQNDLYIDIYPPDLGELRK